MTIEHYLEAMERIINRMRKEERLLEGLKRNLSYVEKEASMELEADIWALHDELFTIQDSQRQTLEMLHSVREKSVDEG